MSTIRRRATLLAGLILLSFLSSTVGRPLRAAGEEIPAQINDQAFWQMIVDLSEPGGFFRADNFVSNEISFQYPIPELRQNTKTGGAYLGVGPDQNFTYIVSMKPKIAFIVDIRRQNMLQHLMYKALMELSADRAEFLSRLFSRQRPKDLDSVSSAEALFQAYADVPANRELYTANIEVIKKQLTDHGFELTTDDEKSIQYILSAFYAGGPDLTYNGAGNAGFAGRNRMPTYAELMMETDRTGQNRSYLSSEENFQYLREMERKNLIVPLVGDFAGPKALRAVGEYLKARAATVTAFYLSNVEQYLFQQEDDWIKFYSNVGNLPLTPESVFIRSVFNGMIPTSSTGFGLRSASVLSSIPDLLQAFDAGKIRAYYDVIAMSH